MEPQTLLEFKTGEFQSSLQRNLIKRIENGLGANLFEIDGKVWLVNDFGKMKIAALVENDVEYFKKWLASRIKASFYGQYRHLTDEGYEEIRRTFKSIYLHIIGTCNSNCKVCYLKDSNDDFFEKEMPLEFIKHVLKSLGRNKNIVLFGGEPTMKEDLFDVIDEVRKSGNVPMICTNGLKLAENDFTSALKEHGMKRVILSFDGFEEDIYEKTRGGRHQLHLKMRALENLEKNKMETYLFSTIIGGINEDQVEKLIKFAVANNHFIKGIFFLGGTPYSGKFEVDSNGFLGSSDLVKLLEKATGEEITREYYLEFYKLNHNLNAFFSKLKINFPRYFDGVLYKINGKNIEELVPLEEVRRINRMMESRKYLAAFLKLVKYFNVKNAIKIVKDKLMGKAIYGFDSFGQKTLHIFCGNLCSPLNNLHYEKDNIGVFTDDPGADPEITRGDPKDEG